MDRLPPSVWAPTSNPGVGAAWGERRTGRRLAGAFQFSVFIEFRFCRTSLWAPSAAAGSWPGFGGLGGWTCVSPARVRDPEGGGSHTGVCHAGVGALWAASSQSCLLELSSPPAGLKKKRQDSREDGTACVHPNCSLCRATPQVCRFSREVPRSRGAI